MTAGAIAGPMVELDVRTLYLKDLTLIGCTFQDDVVFANMDTITESEMANYIGEKGGIGVLHRFMTIEENIRMFKRCEGPAFVSIGCTDEDLERTEALRDAGADYFCVDVAHAHYVGKTLSRRQALTCDVPKRRRESEVAERGGVHKVISECPALLPACRGLG